MKVLKNPLKPEDSSLITFTLGNMKVRNNRRALQSAKIMCRKCAESLYVIPYSVNASCWRGESGPSNVSCVDNSSQPRVRLWVGLVPVPVLHKGREESCVRLSSVARVSNSCPR
jgi:hypothetical protein